MFTLFDISWLNSISELIHDDVIKWKLFPRYGPFVWGIHRSPVNSPHKGQWRGALMFSLICAWINDWVNNGQADDLRRHCIHYDVIVMTIQNRDTKWQNINSLHGVHEPPWHQWKCWPLEDAVVSCLWLVPGLSIQIIIVCKIWYFQR